jgi:UDPglucose 6-dehydrogenase
VVGIDIDADKVEMLRGGRPPFHEPELEPLVAGGVESGSLRFHTDVRAAACSCEAIFMCVGTPPTPSGAADLTQIEDLAWAVAEHIDGYRVVVEKSTVPVETGDRILRTLNRLDVRDVDVVSNPEFLREGTAVADTLEPDRIVIGSSSRRATELLLEIYEPIMADSGCQVLVTDVGTAELIKHASNAFLATKISFINAVAEICEATNTDVRTVARGMGTDHRIGPSFLDAGAGYGGSCFPKDVAAFADLAERLGCDFGLLDQVQEINARGVLRLLDKVREQLWHLKGKKVAVLGLSFKPGTDDLRESPAMKMVGLLVDDGAEVAAYDPVAMTAPKEELPSEVRLAASATDALVDAHAAVFMTGWFEFRDLSLAEMKATMAFPIVVDGRNLFEVEDMRAAGFTHLSVGRPSVLR